jgi:GT2 family glycosyltransferase
VKVSIVIPNWNGAEKLRHNLPDVIQAAMFLDQEAKVPFSVTEIIVVDDASSDNSLDVLKKEFPQVRVIAKKKNSGFSGTVNIGVAASHGEIVVLLNSDAKPQKNFLQYAIPHFAEKSVFSVGCNVGGNWSWAKFENGYVWHYAVDKKLIDTKKAHETLWASGGSGVFRKSIWEELGGLDELFNPFYEEDFDLGYRATKRGYINLWEPRSIVEHYKEKGVIETHFKKSRVATIAQRNQLYFIWKNISSKQMTSEHKKALLKQMKDHPKYSRIVFSALVHLPEVLKKRKIERQHQKLTDEQILSKYTF